MTERWLPIMMWRRVDARPNLERVGFCGLAGEPLWQRR